MSLTAGPNLTTPRVIAQDGKDSRRVIVSRPAHLAIVDVESGRERPLLTHERKEPGTWGRLMSLSRDGRTLAYLASQAEGDVWMMTIDTSELTR